MDFTLGNINDLVANPAWQEIVKRFSALEQAADKNMENSDPAVNRAATGERRVLRALLGMPEQFRGELKK